MALGLISNNSTFVGVLLSHIITNYFVNNSHSTCVIQTNRTELYTGPIYHPFVIIQTTRDVRRMESILKSRIDIGCQSFIVAEDVLITFLDGYQKIRNQREQRLVHIRVVTVWDELNETQFRNGVLHHPIIAEVHNILIIQTTNQTTISLFTIDIRTKYNIPTLVLVDTYNHVTGKFHQNADLFPKSKIRNLNKRAIKLATFNYQPYAIWKSVPPGEGNANTLNSTDENDIWVDGTEIMLFLEFCDKFNCTLTVFTDDNGEWGEIFENNAGNGIIGAIYENTVDVGVGALYAWYAVYIYFALSTPISRTGITCFVLRPKLKSRIFMPIYPFAYDLWIAVITSIIGSAIGLKCIKIVRQKIDPNNCGNKNFTEQLLDVYKIYLLQSIERVSNHTTVKIVIGCTLLIGLMIGNAYSGGLASVTTVPQYEQAIETVQQLADSDLNWAATHDAWIFSIKSATHPTLVTLVNKFHTYPKEVLAREMEMANLAFSIERLPYGHFAIGEYITENGLQNYQIMLEDIYWEFCVAMSSKTWSLLPLLDELILRIAESGIQKYWELKVVMRHANNKIQSIAKSKNHNKDGPISLDISHLLGVFGVLILGLLVSACVFVGELLVNIFYK